MVSSFSTSSKSGRWRSHGHRGTERHGDVKARLDAVVCDYISGLPQTFESDASPPLLDDEEQMRLEFSQLDTEGLQRRAMDSARRCSDALDELLEQELVLSDTLAELRSLESQLRDREEDIEMLRMELQAADDYAEVLLREKADALRKLNEAKNELAHISTKAASLQRDLDAKTRREKEVTDSLVSTPRTTAADARCNSLSSLKVATPNQVAEHGMRGVDRSNNLRRELLRRTMQLRERHPRATSSDATPMVGASGDPVSPMASDSLEHSFRDLSLRGLDPRRSWCPQNTDVPQDVVENHLCKGNNTKNNMGDNDNANSNVEWRRLFLESEKQNEMLRAELVRVQACVVGGDAVPLEVVSSHKKVSAHSSTQELQLQLQRNTAELERVERELRIERARSRRQSRLEMQLLKDVGLLAQKLRVHKNVDGVLQNQQQLDLQLSKEQLLEELYSCRTLVSNLSDKLNMVAPTAATAAVEATTEDKSGSRAKSEATIAEELAAALEDALVANETLRTEKECVLSEKRMREASYEAELRSRVAEMDELTAALHELRDQVHLLRKKRFSSPTDKRTHPCETQQPSRRDVAVAVENSFSDSSNAADALLFLSTMSGGGNAVVKSNGERNFDASLKALGSLKQERTTVGPVEAPQR